MREEKQVLTKYVLSVWAPRANVVYAVSPFERSEVKSQNFPSRKGFWSEFQVRWSGLPTLRLTNECYPFRKLFGCFRCGRDARDEAKSKPGLVDVKSVDVDQPYST